ncbi:S1/P1 Nuclease [Mucilaginibacter limnophilus]|uniref:S1/P1 Nuclease n=1 Tax=Mucilaginibacter limnophilus TaxID=1932778 RepID=A0A437MUN4_9SPHI|nr:S1/P1 nuclease [Mucilaginibacter limnophilus]RVU01370.1 S1/P1 Nuclease [Mucilaginibacter limnophilus]
MKRFSLICLLAAIIFCSPLKTFAWGQQGHRITGQIADSYLNSKARKAIQAILGNESIAMASTWADFIKSDSTYNYLYNWHFVDFDRVYSLPEMQAHLLQDTTVNAYTKVQFLVAELKKKTLPQDKKLLYLRVLIHLVEDVHQPFHTGRESDKGGNDVKLIWMGNPSNLHSVWDSQLIDFQQLSYTEYAASINFTTAAQRTEWQKASIINWIYESHELAQKIYADTKPDDKLGYRYNFKYIGIVNQQLVKGGVHLAGLLNEIFG